MFDVASYTLLKGSEFLSNKLTMFFCMRVVSVLSARCVEQKSVS